MAIITVADYKAFAGITGGDQDLLISNTIDAVQKSIERYCGRGSFDAATFTDNLDGHGQPWVQVKSPPLSTITSVTLKHSSSATTAYDSAAELAANFRWDTDDNGGIIEWINARRGRLPADEWDDPALRTAFGASPAFPPGHRNVVVVYAGGYAASAMPADLQQVCRRMVAREMSDATVGAIQSETIGGYSYTRAAASELDERDRRALAPFVLGRAMSG